MEYITRGIEPFNELINDTINGKYKWECFSDDEEDIDFYAISTNNFKAAFSIRKTISLGNKVCALTINSVSKVVMIRMEDSEDNYKFADDLKKAITANILNTKLEKNKSERIKIKIDKDLINLIIKETINDEREWIFEDRRFISHNENGNVLLRFEKKKESRFLDLVFFDINRGKLGSGGDVILETNEDLWNACNVLKYHMLESINKKAT